jgi:hypothetical protein
MYIFGSKLIKKIYSDFREPNDTDWVTNDINDYNSNQLLSAKRSNRENEVYYIPCTPSREMTADEIYTLKFSHAIYDIHWEKTMSDIRFLQLKGCKLIPEFLKELRNFWEIKHNSKRCDFKVDESSFFDDNIKRKIPHDELHLIFNPNPSYKLIIDGVEPIEEKFLSLNPKQKDDIIWEEAFVIAIERYIENFPYRTAYKKSQRDLITRLHPIWMSDYIIINWNKFFTTKINYYEQYEENYKRRNSRKN